jgi:hypothetical protein
MTDWTCYHYFKEFEASPHYEVPVYASKCEHDDEISNSHILRRLQDTSRTNLKRALRSSNRRKLDHVHIKTYAQSLPTNTFAFSLNHLVLHPKVGLNGQVRILENPYTADGSEGTGDYSLFGLMYGQQYESTTDDFVTIQVQTMTSGTIDGSWYDEEFPLLNNVLKGKMRGAFGPFAVVNEDLYETSVYSWFDTSGSCCSLSSTQGFDSMYTTTNNDAAV